MPAQEGGGEIRDAPRHTGKAQSVHRQKDDVDADPENPEVDETEEKRRVQDLVIEPGIDGDHRAHREHIMKVGHDKVGVVKANGEARVGEDHAG